MFDGIHNIEDNIEDNTCGISLGVFNLISLSFAALTLEISS